MPVEWSVRKFTGFDPEIGTVGYADTMYSLSLDCQGGSLTYYLAPRIID